MEPNPPTLLKDIAKAAGYHYTTVARALKGNPSIAKATRLHIQKIAKELNYQPDPMLQALVRYRHNTMKSRMRPVIAFISHESKKVFASQKEENHYFNGATEQANRLGYKIEYFWHRDPTISDKRWNQILLARGIQVVITASFPCSVNSLDLDWTQFSAVKISVSPPEPRLDTVSCNQIQTIRTAFRKLKSLGYSRIAYADFSHEDDRLENMWSAGYYVEQAKIPESQRVPFIACPSPLSGDFLKATIDRYKIDAILGTQVIYKKLRGANIRLPQDVAFAHINLHEPTSGSLPYAGMKQSYFEVGQMAVNLVTRLHEANIRGLPKLPSVQYIESKWVDGPTVKPKSSIRRTKKASSRSKRLQPAS